MRRSRIERLDAELQGITALVDETTERRFFRVLRELRAMRTEAALGVLLARIEDREHDIQEELLHAAESFPPRMYATAIAREILPLHQRAPYRASILISRIIQSLPDRTLLAAAMAGAGPEVQNALARATDVVRSDRPDLNPVIDQFMQSVRSRTGPPSRRKRRNRS